MNCTLCGKTIAGVEIFGEHGTEMCFDDWMGLQEDLAATLPKPVECGICHKIAAYEKARVGYPGLFHCAECGAWTDIINGTAWTYKQIEKVG